MGFGPWLTHSLHTHKPNEIGSASASLTSTNFVGNDPGAGTLIHRHVDVLAKGPWKETRSIGLVSETHRLGRTPAIYVAVHRRTARRARSLHHIFDEVILHFFPLHVRRHSLATRHRHRSKLNEKEFITTCN